MMVVADWGSVPKCDRWEMALVRSVAVAAVAELAVAKLAVAKLVAASAVAAASPEESAVHA